MGFFDRFTSRKGKERTGKPKAGRVAAEEAKQKTFAAVPAGQEETKTSAKAEAAKPTLAKTSTHQAHHVLLRPVVTEKTTRLQHNAQYVFMIHAAATKVDVRHAVQHAYGVQPERVNIINLPGKWVRYGRSVGRTTARRKAIVTLPAGKTIDPTI